MIGNAVKEIAQKGAVEKNHVQGALQVVGGLMRVPRRGNGHDRLQGTIHSGRRGVVEQNDAESEDRNGQ